MLRECRVLPTRRQCTSIRTRVRGGNLCRTTVTVYCELKDRLARSQPPLSHNAAGNVILEPLQEWQAVAEGKRPMA
jgi:hypothetical protein